MSFRRITTFRNGGLHYDEIRFNSTTNDETDPIAKSIINGLLEVAVGVGIAGTC